MVTRRYAAMRRCDAAGGGARSRVALFESRDSSRGAAPKIAVREGLHAHAAPHARRACTEGLVRAGSEWRCGQTCEQTRLLLRWPQLATARRCLRLATQAAVRTGARRKVEADSEQQCRNDAFNHVRLVTCARSCEARGPATGSQSARRAPRRPPVPTARAQRHQPSRYERAARRRRRPVTDTKLPG